MIPIRVKQFPHFVRDLIAKIWIMQRKEYEKPVFYLCYFSCQSYFKYLYCSLHSLVRFLSNIQYEVLIFNDEEMPLSEIQIREIHKLIPTATVISWPKSMGWGEKQIEWIWKAYKVASDKAKDTDIVVRVDSDVFFFNDRIFRQVSRSKSELIGDGHFVNFKYCQGGCYFFRASAIRKIEKMLKTISLSTVLSSLDEVVEDIAAYQFAKKLSLPTWLTWFMMFPDELRNAGGLSAMQKMKFSCIHFVMKNKDEMLRAYEREILHGAIPDDYSNALKLQ